MRCSVVAILCLVAAQVHAARADDVFAVDGRSDTPVSVHALRANVPAVLADISRQSGLPLAAEGEPHEQRVTLIATKRTARDTLLALASFLDYEWRTDGARYVLFQSPQAREAQAARLIDRIRRSAAAILVEAREGARPLTEPDVSPWPWRRLICRVLSRMSQDDVVRLISEGSPDAVWPARTGSATLPKDMLDDVMREAGPQQRRALEPAIQAGFLVLHFEACLMRGVPCVRCFASCRPIDPKVQSLWVTAQFVENGRPIMLPSDDRREALAVEEDGPAWPTMPAEGRVTVDMPLELPPGPQPGQPDPPLFHLPMLGDYLDAVARSWRQDIMADCFANVTPGPIQVSDTPAGEVMDQIARKARMRWRVERGFVMVASTFRAVWRAAEPPAAFVDDLRDRIGRGPLSLNDLVAIASLSDARLCTLGFAWPVYGISMASGPAASGRTHLRLWGVLSARQRNQALGDGLPYRAMTPAQQKLFVSVLSCLDTAGPADPTTEPGMAALVAASRLRVKREPVAVLGLAGQEGYVSGMTREAAARALVAGRAIEPSTLREGTCEEFTFTYDSRDTRLAWRRVRLAPAWKDAAGK